MPLPDSVAAADPTYKTATVANGAAVSGVVDLKGKVLVGIYVPAGMLPTPAVLTLRAGTDPAAVTSPLTDLAGADLSIPVAAGRYIPVDPGLTIGVRHVALVLGGVVTGATTFTLVLRGY